MKMFLRVFICLAISASRVAQGLEYAYNSDYSIDTADYFLKVVEDYKNSWADKLAGIRDESRASYYLAKLNTTIAGAERIGQSDCVKAALDDVVIDETILDEAVGKCNENIPREGHEQLEDALTETLQNIQTIDDEIKTWTDGCYGIEICLQNVDDYAEEQFTELKKTAVPEITRAAFLLYSANFKSIRPCVAEETAELTESAKNAVNSIRNCVNNELSTS